MKPKTKIAFIINGAKKLSRESKLALDLAQSNIQLNCRIIYTTKSKDAIAISEQEVNSGATIIIAVGGDGTCNEVVCGIQKSERSKEVIFGIIPNGSGNDFHRMLGPFSPEKFNAALTHLNGEWIDLIQIHSQEGTRYSLNIAGVGFDGFVINKLNEVRKKNILKGKTAYVYSILHSFCSFKKPTVTIKSAPFNYSGKMLLKAVCNGTTFGYGLVIAPEAKINDGKLNITFFGKVSILDYIRHVSKLKKGKRIDHPEVHYFETEELTISVQQHELYLETDGEIGGSGAVRFQLLPKSLQLLRPEY